MKHAEPISFRRHVEIGIQLHKTSDSLWALRKEISESKRNANSKEALHELMKALASLEHLRSHLENVLCTSGVLDDESVTCNPCTVYYGPFNEVAK